MRYLFLVGIILCPVSYAATALENAPTPIVQPAPQVVLAPGSDTLKSIQHFFDHAGYKYFHHYKTVKPFNIKQGHRVFAKQSASELTRQSPSEFFRHPRESEDPYSRDPSENRQNLDSSTDSSMLLTFNRERS